MAVILSHFVLFCFVRSAADNTKNSLVQNMLSSTLQYSKIFRKKKKNANCRRRVSYDVTDLDFRSY